MLNHNSFVESLINFNYLGQNIYTKVGIWAHVDWSDIKKPIITPIRYELISAKINNTEIFPITKEFEDFVADYWKNNQKRIKEIILIEFERLSVMCLQSVNKYPRLRI